MELFTGGLNTGILILALGSAGLFFILMFVVHLSRKQTNFLPLALFVLLSLVEFLVYGIKQVSPSAYPYLLYVTEPFSMLYGLLIYLYVRNYAQPKIGLRKSDLIYLVPFALSLLTYIPYYALSGEEKLADFLVHGSLKADVFANIWEWNFEVVVNSAFLIASLRELKKYTSLIKEQFSDIHKIRLKLTFWVIRLSIAAYLLELCFVYCTFFGFPYYELMFSTFNLINLFVLLGVAYEAIVSQRYMEQMRQSWEQSIAVEDSTSETEIKYARSAIDHDSSEEIASKLRSYMEENKAYLQTQLRIKDLADLLDIPSHHLSQVINQVFEQNFYEFVNTYRIEEAKRMLKDSAYQNYTIEALAYEVGFNSRSAFYTAFKKITGTSPSNY